MTFKRDSRQPRRDARHLRVGVGTGLPNQNFTLVIGGAGYPMPARQFLYSVSVLLGLAALRRKLRC